MRIAKFLSQCGIASRRKSEELIREGRVTINGQKIDDPANNVDPETDEITFNGKEITLPSEHLTLLYHKPREVIISNTDPEGRQTIFDELPVQYAPQKDRLRYAGRLDFMSEGLIVLSTDGDLINRLSHPSNGCVKRYLVQLNYHFTAEDREKCLKGVVDSGEVLKCLKIEPIANSAYKIVNLGKPSKHTEDSKWICITLQEGKNRHIRRMMQGLGYHIRRLQRVSMGAMTIDEVECGAWKELRTHDLVRLTEKVR